MLQQQVQSLNETQQQMLTKQLNEMDKREFKLTEAESNLSEYWSHLARHKSKGNYDAKEIKHLEKDTAIIGSDYKMKILACYFCKNQQK